MSEQKIPAGARKLGEAIAQYIADDMSAGIMGDTHYWRGRIDSDVAPLVEALDGLAELRLREVTAEVVEDVIVETTSDGELADHVRRLLSEGSCEARAALAHWKGNS